MSDNVPKIITFQELNHKLLKPYNLDKGDKFNILKEQVYGGVPAVKELAKFILKQKALEAKIDLKIRRENSKLDIKIKEAEFKIEKERNKLKIKENQAIRDSLLKEEKEKIDLL